MFCHFCFIEFISGHKTNCFALSEDGAVFAWGTTNTSRQLGIGNFTSVVDGAAEAVLGSLEGKKVIKLATCEKHTLALTDQGELHAWGDNKKVI